MASHRRVRDIKYDKTTTQSRIDVAIGGKGDLFDESRVKVMLNLFYDGRDAESQSMPDEIVDVIRRNMCVGSWKG